jgi:hypothetical protein
VTGAVNVPAAPIVIEPKLVVLIAVPDITVVPLMINVPLL